MTSNLITLHNTRFINILPAAKKYAQNKENFAKAEQPKQNIQYKTVNQLLKESPLVGSTKFGYNFIA